MKTEQLALFLISPDSTVVEAMQRIDRNARGILFVTNEQQKLLGVVTDGDIRRWLIRTGELKAPVSGLMNTEPKRISRKEHAKAHEVMVQHSITALPVVTTKGVVSDILFRDEQVAKRKSRRGFKRGSGRDYGGRKRDTFISVYQNSSETADPDWRYPDHGADHREIL